MTEKRKLSAVSEKSSDALEVNNEKLRQEGREEVLEWLRMHEVLSYSKPENVYFRYDWRTEMMLILPWNKAEGRDVG